MSLVKHRSRLKSISNLNSILSAMQIVTMVRMQRIREKNILIETYLHPIREILGGMVHKKETKQKILVLVSSTRGLCGSFNSELFNKVKEFINKYRNINYIAIGQKSDEFLKRQKLNILFSNYEILGKNNYSNACELFKNIFNGEAELFVAYNSYQSGSYYFPVIRKLYPIPYELINIANEKNILYEPNIDILTENLFYHYLETSFYQIIVNSQISEFTARLMVLKNAVDNSKELIDKLVLNINKTRQSDITKDLSEIIASVQVLMRAEDE